MQKIFKCETDEQILHCFEVMSQLRPHLIRGDFVAKIREQESSQNYHLVALKDGDGIAATMGIRISTCLSKGKYAYIDDIVTDTNSRSKGYGLKLLHWAEVFARQEECHVLRLDSGVSRDQAHRFYFREGMSVAAFHFQKAL